MKTLLRRYVLLLLPLVAACSSSAGTQVSGAINGTSFAHPTAIALIQDPLRPGDVHQFAILIANDGEKDGPLGTNPICSDLVSGVGLPSTKGLFLHFAALKSDGTLVEPTPGEYSTTFTFSGPDLSMTRYASVEFADLKPMVIHNHGAGSLQISNLDFASGRIEGSFDLAFGADHVTGAFVTVSCPGLSRAVLSTLQDGAVDENPNTDGGR